MINSSDASHFIPWKKNGWLAPFVSEDIARYFPPEYRDPDGMFATSRIWLSSIAYNTNLVKPEDAPKSFADLLDPKWAGKMVKGHPAYSGTIMTATFQIVRELGWEYFEKLSKQRVMQVQSSTDPPKKLSLGERAVMADGNEYGVVLLKEAGQPVEPVYPTEGTPTISGPTGIFATAPHPNAARLFQAWLHTPQTQQFFIDFTAQYSVHAQVQSKPGRRKISDIKLMKEDAAGVEKMTEEIKTRYAKLFRVSMHLIRRGRLCTSPRLRGEWMRFAASRTDAAGTNSDRRQHDHRDHDRHHPRKDRLDQTGAAGCSRRA